MTRQIRDSLTIEDNRYDIVSPGLPADHPGIRKADVAQKQLNMDKITVEDVVLFSTACRRGYVADWEIKNARLYLVELVGRSELRDNQPLFADWISHTIRIPISETERHLDGGDGRILKEEHLIVIEHGIVIREGWKLLDGDHRRSTVNGANLPLLNALINQVSAGFPEPKHNVLRMRYGLEDGMKYTLNEVSQRLDISLWQASQIESMGLRFMLSESRIWIQHKDCSRWHRDELHRINQQIEKWLDEPMLWWDAGR